MKKLFIKSISLIILFALSNQAFCQLGKAKVDALAKAYFKTYAERNDWRAFLDFYDEALYFEDLQFRLVCANLDSFKRFYDWPNPAFKKIDDEKPILKLEQLLVNDSTAVGIGFFDSFYWQNQYIPGPWEFSIKLVFNSEGKIIRQTDFINYPLAFLCGNEKLNKDIVLWMENRKQFIQPPE